MLSKLLPNDIKLPGWMNPSSQLRYDTSNGWQKKIVIGIAGAAVVLYVWKRYANRNLPPGPTGWPIIGSKHLLEGDKLYSGLDELGRQYGDVFSIQNGTTFQIYLNSHSAIKEAYVMQGEVFACRPLDEANGLHLMDLKDDVFGIPYQTPGWNENKSRLTSSLRATGFGKSGVEDKMFEQIELLIPHLDKLAERGETLNFSDILPKITANVISQVLMNKKYDLDDPKLAEFCKMINSFMGAFGDSFSLRPVPKLLITLLYNKLAKSIIARTNVFRAYVQAEIEEHMKTLNPDEPRDFIDVYLNKSGGGHAMDRMVDNVMIFIPDACDSMVVIISWLFLFLTRYDDVQRKVAEEIKAVTGGNRYVTWADRATLPYTEATIMEIIRLEPIFATAPAHTVSREITFRGYRILPEMTVIANLRAALRDPQVYDKPDEFNPDRFLDDDGGVIKSDAWIPFGMGRRKCPGEQVTKMETFLITANIIQTYKLTFPDGECPALVGSQGIINMPPKYRVKLTARI